jgi:hypothetical protein
VANYARVANIFTLPGYQWAEHVYFVRADGGDVTLEDFTHAVDLMSLWFVDTIGPGGESRSSMLPELATLDSVIIREVVTDLVPDSGLIFDAILGVPGANTAPPLPANVSKEVERYSRTRKRGLYGRWHLGGLTSNDVDADDQRRMDSYAQSVYLALYQGLQGILESISFGHEQLFMVNGHSAPRADADDYAGWWSYVTAIDMVSPYFGTMQVRTPGHYR